VLEGLYLENSTGLKEVTLVIRANDTTLRPTITVNDNETNNYLYIVTKNNLTFKSVF
jgi:hypothetical protein